jgi:predicted transcriptional regulator
MSIKEKHNRNIEKKLKTNELRLRPPKCELPFKVLTYESGFDGRHKIVNEWVCDDIVEYRICVGVPSILPQTACLSVDEILEYSGKQLKNISAMHISNLVIYDKPKDLSEFYTKCHIPENKCKCCDNCFLKENGYGKDHAIKKITRPPQSWCYVKERE